MDTKRGMARAVDKVAQAVRKIQTMRVNSQTLYSWLEEHVAHVLHQLQWIRLRIERQVGTLLSRGTLARVMGTACWHFPIYSQTFVYQELTQLLQRGFAVRFLYAQRNPRAYLPSQFARLAQ